MRGHRSDGVFSHMNGKGWVAARKGEYDDAVNVKRHHFDLLLHETLGGFSVCEF